MLRVIGRLNVGGPTAHVMLPTEGLDCSRHDPEAQLKAGTFGPMARSLADRIPSCPVRLPFAPMIVLALPAVSGSLADTAVFDTRKDIRAVDARSAPRAYVSYTLIRGASRRLADPPSFAR
jgi:hypothetical protein